LRADTKSSVLPVASRVDTYHCSARVLCKLGLEWDFPSGLLSTSASPALGIRLCPLRANNSH
jgi:hypothetical protein